MSVEKMKIMGVIGKKKSFKQSFTFGDFKRKCAYHKRSG